MPRVGDDGARGTGSGKVDGCFSLSAGEGNRAGALNPMYTDIWMYV